VTRDRHSSQCGKVGFVLLLPPEHRNDLGVARLSIGQGLDHVGCPEVASGCVTLSPAGRRDEAANDVLSVAHDLEPLAAVPQ
jgi:hypothetical protein